MPSKVPPIVISPPAMWPRVVADPSFDLVTGRTMALRTAELRGRVRGQKWT